MDERLVYATRRSVRRRQIVALCALAALVLVAASGYFELTSKDWLYVGALGITIAVVVLVLQRHVTNPVPELRLSSDGIEGTFGLLAWPDVQGATVRRRFGLLADGVLVHLLPGAPLEPATRSFTQIDHDWYGKGLELKARHLELGPRELAREIERFRAYYASPGVPTLALPG